MKKYQIFTRKKERKLLRYAFFVSFGSFAIMGLVFSSVFVAMRYELLAVGGLIQDRNSFYETLPKSTTQNALLSKVPTPESCLTDSGDGIELVATCNWNSSDEWAVVRAGLEKDRDVIQRVSEETGVSARMIAATITPEQLRFFTSSRDTYKQYFEPLKILGSMTKFSLGVSGIKHGTARQIEQYVVDINSPFYPREDLSSLIDYEEIGNTDQVLYNRLTSEDHYWSYLYTALFIRQIEAHWNSYGYDVSDRPDVVVTLFNIGFSNSAPKSNPQMGGAAISLNGETYSFGELGVAFYLSDELAKIFPRETTPALDPDR